MKPAAANRKNDDSDLADLLASPEKQRQQQQQRPQNVGICQLISSHLSYLCFHFPSTCGCLSCVAMFLVVTYLITAFVNPNQTFGGFTNDWSSVNSAFDLDVGKIDHWCLGGGNDGCKCEDPLLPVSRVELRSWTEAFKENKKQIEKYVDDPVLMADLDVAIIGESAIEEMDGRWMGRRPNDELINIGTIFKNHFHRERGAKVEGVALGIAGDSANNVLWRLLHGEMPETFNPKVWWVHIGMNDLTRQQCSEEVVVLGVLRVVEEILKQRPDARVVINSLLPMADLRGGMAVKDKDYRDAFDTYGGKRGRASAIHYVRKNVDGREKIVPRNQQKKPKRSSSSSDDHHKKHGHNHRQLLERALEAYSARENDNSEDIENLQRELKAEVAKFAAEDVSGEEDGEVFANRRLEESEKPERRARDKYNPTINGEKHKQKKYNFFRKRRMPLWTSIFAINKQLFKFCEKHAKVDFFDATNIFAEKKSHDDGSGSQKFFTLMSDVISSRGHPTEMGFVRWEDAIVGKLTTVLDEMRLESPGLFLSTIQGVDQPVGGKSATEVERLEKIPLVDDNRGEDMPTSPPSGNTLGEDGGEGTDDANDGVDNENENALGEEGGEADTGANQEGEATQQPSGADEPEEDDSEDESSNSMGGQGTPVQPGNGLEPQFQQGPGGMQQGSMQQGMNLGGYPQQQQYGGAQGGYQQQPQSGMQGGYQQQPQSGMQGGYQQQPQSGMQGGYQQPQSGAQGGYQQQPQSGTQGGYQQQQQGGIQGGYQQQPQGGTLGGYQQPLGSTQGGYQQQQPQSGMQGSYQRPQGSPQGAPQGGSNTNNYQGNGGNAQTPPEQQQGGYNQGQPIGGMGVGAPDTAGENDDEEQDGDAAGDDATGDDATGDDATGDAGDNDDSEDRSAD